LTRDLEVQGSGFEVRKAGPFPSAAPQCQDDNSKGVGHPILYFVRMERRTKVIPSGRKSKIPATLVWPVRAQEVSAALMGVPQFDELALSFQFHQNDLLAFQWTWMTLLRVNYSKYDRSFSNSRDMIEHGWLDRRWRIVITPVLRSEAKAIRASGCCPRCQSLRTGLPGTARCRPWARNPSFLYGRKRRMRYISTEADLEPERV
jgi:hypothetical protein